MKEEKIIFFIGLKFIDYLLWDKFNILINTILLLLFNFLRAPN
jgi:hypothetical protein